MKRPVLPLLSILGLSLLLTTAAVAQPSAQQIMDRSLEAYTSMMADVNSYLMTMEMMGMEHQSYFERVEGGGPLEYRHHSRIYGQTGWTVADEEMPGGTTVPTEEMFQRIRAQGRFAGEHTVDGQRAYAIAIDEPGDVFDPGDLPTDGDFDFDSMTFYVAADNYTFVGFDAEGTARSDGRAAPVTMEMRVSDFRTVGPMMHPFVTTMRIDGLADGLSDEERRQLEEAKRQMEQMPAEQRQMMERMMGDQLEQLERMAAGEAMKVEMRITDLQVNVPRPD